MLKSCFFNFLCYISTYTITISYSSDYCLHFVIFLFYYLIVEIDLLLYLNFSSNSTDIWQMFVHLSGILLALNQQFLRMWNDFRGDLSPLLTKLRVSCKWKEIRSRIIFNLHRILVRFREIVVGRNASEVF